MPARLLTCRLMPLINENFLKLQAGYLFPEIARRVRTFAEKHPDRPIIKLGIGDVTEPLVPAIAEAMRKAVDEMTTDAGFRGYGPSEGYDFLRSAIATNDYRSRGCDVADDEIFVSDGSKCDSANLLDILGHGNTIAVTDPVYPVYVDTNVMAGNAEAAGSDGRYGGMVYLEATEANGFAPALPDRPVDVIYLCFPNNPTGAVASKQTLKAWVDYARKHKRRSCSSTRRTRALSRMIRSRTASTRSTEPAQCAIEFRSFSKTAGFTGTRCAFTVVPKELMGRTKDGREIAMHGLWGRRQNTKFNGVAYIVQRGAEAVYRRRWPTAGARPRRRLHGQRTVHQRGVVDRRPDRLRRRQRPVLLGQVPRRPRLVGHVRPPAGAGRRRLHARRRLRPMRRGVLPPERLQLPGERRGGVGTDGRGFLIQNVATALPVRGLTV